MDQNRKKELEAFVAGMWQQMESSREGVEDFLPAAEAMEDRRALGRRIGRLYLAFSRVLINRLGEEEAKKGILEAIRDYAYYCAEARKRGGVDLPQRGIHKKSEVVEVDGQKRLRCYGCGIAEEFAHQDEEKLGALYCYIDPCSFMLTLPNIKLYHKQMEPLGADYCEFDLAIVSDEEMGTVLLEGMDYRGIDPIIKEGTEGQLLKGGKKYLA